MSRTLRRGLVGMVVCVGGGARDDPEREGGPRFGRGARRGGGISPPPETCGWRAGMEFSRCRPWTPPEALCAELSAGKEGTVGSASCVSGFEREKDGRWEARGVGGEPG